MSKLSPIFARIKERVGKLSRRERILIAVASVTVLVAGIGFWSYTPNLPAFSPITLTKSGVRASLRTKWVDRQSRYMLTIRPIRGSEARFDDVLRSDSGFSFDVYLHDSDGFQVCKGSPNSYAPSREVGDDGKYSRLELEGAFFCARSELTRAAGWSVSYNFPSLPVNTPAASQSPPPVESVPSPQHLATKANPKTAPSLTIPKAVPPNGKVATLTGADFFSGSVETLADGSYRITKSAERQAVIAWQPSDKLQIECPDDQCVITDSRTGTSVHVKKTD